MNQVGLWLLVYHTGTHLDRAIQRSAELYQHAAVSTAVLGVERLQDQVGQTGTAFKCVVAMPGGVLLVIAAQAEGVLQLIDLGLQDLRQHILGRAGFEIRIGLLRLEHTPAMERVAVPHECQKAFGVAAAVADVQVSYLTATATTEQGGSFTCSLPFSTCAVHGWIVTSSG